MANFRSLSELISEIANQSSGANVPDGTTLALTYGQNQPFGNQQPIQTRYFTWGVSTWGIDQIGPGDSVPSNNSGGSA